MATETYTFRNGITVGIMRVSPDLGRLISKQFPSPKPPVNKTSLGDEVNYADPSYAMALAEHRQLVGDRVFDALIMRGVWVQIDEVAIGQLRKDMAELGVELPANDKVCYVRYICITDASEITELQTLILGMGQPTEAAIQEAQGEFKSDVSG